MTFKHPGLGSSWELLGGGTDPGETYVDTAVRELREETGVVVLPAQVGPSAWRRHASFLHRRTRHLQDKIVVVERLPGPGPDVDEAHRLDYEREDLFGFRWWPVAEVRPGPERFYPGRLPELLPTLLIGEEFDEEFELWS